MEVDKDRVIGICYTLTDGEGNELEVCDPDDPLYYLHGHENIIPGLEAELAGMEEGQEFEVRVEPEDAYGEYDPGFLYRVSRDELPEGLDPKPGMPLRLVPEDEDDAPSGGMIFYVKQVDDDEVILDGNQPLAGRTLNFVGKVVEVRDASKEELDHGHVHGPGGHHHH